MPVNARLGPKAAGQLIKADDWNTLLGDVNRIEQALRTELVNLTRTVTDLVTTTNGLTTRLGTAEAAVRDLRGDVDALLANTYRITLETPQISYALGETAEITARVRDMEGRVPAPVNGERPWVDFVSTWGQLRASPGFVSRAGVGERSISVQTDADGMARVRLSSEIVEDMTEATEVEFGNFLNTKVQNNLKFSDVVLNANTPSDEPVRQAYQFVQSSYDNPQGGSVRNFVDSYYYRNGSKLSGKIAPGLINQRREIWRDHHITVLAFGKTDSDPRSPDAARGTNAIQLKFRDWIGPWILIDYLPKFELEVPNLVNVLRPQITRDFTESANKLTNVVQTRVEGLGLLGKTKQYEALRTAFDTLESPQAVTFMPQLRESMKAAVTLQQSFQQTQVSTPGGGAEEIALQAFSSTAVRANSEVSGVGSQVQQVQQQVSAVQANFAQQVQNLQQSVTALGGRMDATLAEGGQLQEIKKGLNVVTDQVAALRSLGDPRQVTQQIQQISVLNTRLASLEAIRR